MEEQLTSAPVDVARDRYGRPLIIPEAGGRPVPYTRCTTFVGACEDTYKLSQWSQRQAVKGVSYHDDLLSAVRDTHVDNKTTLNDLVNEAKLRAGASDAASVGTYLHAVTEAEDRGLNAAAVPPPVLHGRPPLQPTDYVPDLTAYLAATADLKHVHIEQLMVFDRLKVAGTPDRVVTYEGKRYIADLKTGDIQWGAGKIAAQLAVYARSQVYDIATGARTLHEASVDKGLVIHLPAGSGTCEVLWIDLLAGWEIAKTCREVRERRTIKAFDLYAPFKAPPQPTPLVDQIVTCTSRTEVEALWRAHQHEWHSNLTAAASAHIASLEVAS